MDCNVLLWKAQSKHTKRHKMNDGTIEFNTLDTCVDRGSTAVAMMAVGVWNRILTPSSCVLSPKLSGQFRPQPGDLQHILAAMSSAVREVRPVTCGIIFMVKCGKPCTRKLFRSADDRPHTVHATCTDQDPSLPVESSHSI